MKTRRGEPEHRVASGNVGPRQQRAALGRSDRETAKVVIAVLVEAGHFRGLAANERTARLPAALGDPCDDSGGRVRIELAAGEVVQEEQRLGALHHQIVDRHRHEVDADAVMDAGLDRDLDLGADAVGRRHQNRVGKAGGLEVEQPAETADFGIGARACRGADQRLDHVDQAIARIDIDTRIRVSQPVFALDHAFFHDIRGWLRRIGSPCNGSQGSAAYTICR